MHNKRALDRRLCRAVARLLVTMAWPPLAPSTRNTWQTRKQCARAALRRDFAHLGCAHANKLSPPLSLFFLSRRVHVPLSLSLSLSLLLFSLFLLFFFPFPLSLRFSANSRTSPSTLCTGEILFLHARAITQQPSLIARQRFNPLLSVTPSRWNSNHRAWFVSFIRNVIGLSFLYC